MKIALVIFITLALAGCALLSLHMGVIPVPWRALLTDWQADVPNEVDCTGRKNQTTTE